MVRDYALAASGLLVHKIGGPSVKPYQPDGVWEAVAMPAATRATTCRTTARSLYRRSMYTFWKRSAPPASMEIFNAPSREVCTVRRERTNTPLQALVTLNDPQFVEAARHLAQRALNEGGDDGRRPARLSSAARLLARPLTAGGTARSSKPALNDLLALLPGARRTTPKQLIAVGEIAGRCRRWTRPRFAAWTMLANELMNLDEVLNK